MSPGGSGSAVFTLCIGHVMCQKVATFYVHGTLKWSNKQTTVTMFSDSL